MHRPAVRLALFLTALLSLQPCEVSASSIVIGSDNPLLTEGAVALEAGHIHEGIRLTLAGLKRPNNDADRAAAYANLCAGYAALKRWSKALPHCERSLEIDATNWRALNNRAAVHVGLKEYDRAMADVTAALKFSPDSPILRKSLQVIIQRREAAATLDRRRKPAKA